MKFRKWTRVAEMELVYKTQVKTFERLKKSSVKDCCKLLKELWNENTFEMQKEFTVLLLKVIGIYEASSGGIKGKSY